LKLIIEVILFGKIEINSILFGIIEINQFFSDGLMNCLAFFFIINFYKKNLKEFVMLEL
jgi:hypothetical protein